MPPRRNRDASPPPETSPRASLTVVLTVLGICFAAGIALVVRGTEDQSLRVVGCLLVAFALGGISYVLLGGTGEGEYNGIKVGGSAALCVVFFVLLMTYVRHDLAHDFVGDITLDQALASGSVTLSDVNPGATATISNGRFVFKDLPQLPKQLRLSLTGCSAVQSLSNGAWTFSRHFSTRDVSCNPPVSNAIQGVKVDVIVLRGGQPLDVGQVSQLLDPDFSRDDASKPRLGPDDVLRVHAAFDSSSPGHPSKFLGARVIFSGKIVAPDIAVPDESEVNVLLRRDDDIEMWKNVWNLVPSDATGPWGKNILLCMTGPDADWEFAIGGIGSKSGQVRAAYNRTGLSIPSDSNKRINHGVCNDYQWR